MAKGLNCVFKWVMGDVGFTCGSWGCLSMFWIGLFAGVGPWSTLNSTGHLGADEIGS